MGRVLNDEELDSVFAQGLVVVNVAMSVKRVAERFDFNFTSETKIRTSDVTGDREPAQAKVDFLGGLVSVSAEPNQGSRPSGTPAPASTATATRTFDADNGALSVLVQSFGGEPAPSSNPATSAVSGPSAAQAPAPRPGVTVTFGGGDASRGGSVFAAAAKNASVDSQVNLVIRPSSNAGAMARATFMRQIRSALGGGP